MNRINDIRNKAIITKETMEYFQKHGQTPGFEFLTANDFRYLLSKIDDLQSQLALSTEREERLRSEFDACMRHSLKRDEEMTKYRKALEEIRDSVLYLASDMQKIARQALSSSPAPEPVTVEEVAVVLRTKFISYEQVATCLLTKFKMERRG